MGAGFQGPFDEATVEGFVLWLDLNGLAGHDQTGGPQGSLHFCPARVGIAAPPGVTHTPIQFADWSAADPTDFTGTFFGESADPATAGE